MMSKNDRLTHLAAGAFILAAAALVLALIGLARGADVSSRLDGAEASLGRLQCERDHMRHPGAITCLEGETR